MKKKLLIFYLFFISCHNSKKINLSYINIQESIGKCEDGKDVYIKIKYPLIKNNPELNQLLEKFLLTDFNDVAENVTGILSNFKDDYFEIKKLYPKEKIKCWYVSLNLEVIKDSLDIITFKQYHEEDRGGGHAIINTYYFNYNLWENEIIDLENISKDFEKLTTIAKNKFFKKYEIKSDIDFENKFLFRDNEFYLPDNFYFTEKSINFLFVQGEINDFSQGEFLLEIPYFELKDNLNYKY